MLARGDISEGHARAVLALPDDDSRLRLARRIASDGMTVRAAERAAQDGGARRRPGAPRAATGRSGARRPARAAAERLTGLPARVAGGRLEIRFDDETRSRSSSRRLESL